MRTGQYLHQGFVVSHLNISGVAVQHGGLYECRAENSQATARHAAPLHVYGPPTARAVKGECTVLPSRFNLEGNDTRPDTPPLCTSTVLPPQGQCRVSVNEAISAFMFQCIGIRRCP